jgi:hypothetical protein
MMSDFGKVIKQTSDILEQIRLKEQAAFGKVVKAAITEAGYTLDTLPYGHRFVAGIGYEDFGGFYGFPVEIDETMPAASLVFKSWPVSDE